MATFGVIFSDHPSGPHTMTCTTDKGVTKILGQIYDVDTARRLNLLLQLYGLEHAPVPDTAEGFH
jgi:hypothetical protein